MLKRIHFIFFIYFIIISVQAQSSTDIILVEYVVERGQILNKERLIASQDKAIYIMDSLFVENDKKKKSTLDEETNVITVRQNNVKINASIYYKNSYSNIIHFTQKKGNNKIIVKDSLPKMEWDITSNELKEINDFICKKASLVYRGTQFVAYYTEDIPISFGPWKFKDLPGLILEIHNINERVNYRWVATLVKYPFLDDEFKVNLDFKNSESVIKMEDFVKQRDDKIKNMFKILNSRAPKGAILSNSTFVREGIEKKFEWEEETKQE